MLFYQISYHCGTSDSSTQKAAAIAVVAAFGNLSGLNLVIKKPAVDLAK
jgi:hypothetical protein